MAQESKESACDLTIYCKGNIGATKLGDCPFSQKVLICLSLHGLKFEKRYVNLSDKPQTFLDLNKVSDGSFKLIKGDSWGASTPVLEDRKNKVRIFDSSEICNYLETTYPPAVLAKNNANMDKIPGARSVFGDFIALVKDIGSRNNGVLNGDVDKQMLVKYKKSLSDIEQYLTGMRHSTNSDKQHIYLNGTFDISLADIELIPKLHVCVIHSKNALNIDILSQDKTDYKWLSKYMNYVYQQEWWKANSYDDQSAFDSLRAKFGLNSFDAKYAAKDAETEPKEEKMQKL